MMDIESLVQKYFNPFAVSRDAEDRLRAALTELSEEHERKQALLLEAHCERVCSLQERIRQIEAELAMSATYADYKNIMELVLCYGQEKQSFGATNDAERGIGAGDILAKIRAMLAAAPRRCHLCDYQHGHKIGCVNNPVDIALRAAASAKDRE